MSSELIIKIQKIDEVRDHPNADRLEIVVVGGWETCASLNEFKVGNPVVFIPPDSILPKKLHEYLGVTGYLAQLPKGSDDAQEDKRRVKATRIRGERSFGVLMSCEQLEEYLGISRKLSDLVDFYDFYEGQDIAQLLGITKWVPKEKCISGDIAVANTFFHKYTNIENWRNFPDIFEENEMVVVSEKIHGTNCRVGVVMDNVFTYAAGSHHTQRKFQKEKDNQQSLYWMPLNDLNMVKMIEHIKSHYEESKLFSIIVFCEIYGDGVQDITYGCMNNKQYRVFDIAVNGQYLSWEMMSDYCRSFSVPLVPIIYLGPYSSEVITKFTDGPTQVCDVKDVKTKFKGREGIVIRPCNERFSPDLPNIGRVILKSVSVDYLGRKKATDNA